MRFSQKKQLKQFLLPVRILFFFLQKRLTNPEESTESFENLHQAWTNFWKIEEIKMGRISSIRMKHESY